MIQIQEEAEVSKCKKKCDLHFGSVKFSLILFLWPVLNIETILGFEDIMVKMVIKVVKLSLPLNQVTHENIGIHRSLENKELYKNGNLGDGIVFNPLEVSFFSTKMK